MTKKLLTLALAGGMMAGVAGFAYAQGGGGGGGGSGSGSGSGTGSGMNSPNTGSGSGKATNSQGKGQGGTSGQGASQYAPGHNPNDRVPGQGGTPPGQEMNQQKNKSNR